MSAVGYRSGLLSGDLTAVLPMEEAQYKPHPVNLSSRLKDDRLSGFATATINDERGNFALAGYLSLTRGRMDDKTSGEITRLDSMKVLKTLRISIFGLLFIVFTTGCSNIPSNDEPSPQEADIPTLSLAPANEPGQRLILFGTVVDSQTGEPIPHTEVYLYHADANGEYQPSDPSDESTAKLSGEIITNDAGEFIVDTIVPREYDQPGNRHIHLHYVRAEGYQDGGGVILFENDVNDEIRQWATDTGFGTIIELEEMEGVQRGNVIITLDPE